MGRKRVGRFRMTIWNMGGTRLLVRRMTQREMSLVEEVLRALNLPGIWGNDMKVLRELPSGAERVLVREDMSGSDA